MNKQRPLMRLRPATRAKFEQASQIKRWKFVEVADAAIDSLFRTDPELRKGKRREPQPVA